MPFGILKYLDGRWYNIRMTKKAHSLPKSYSPNFRINSPLSVFYILSRNLVVHYSDFFFFFCSRQKILTKFHPKTVIVSVYLSAAFTNSPTSLKSLVWERGVKNKLLAFQAVKLQQLLQQQIKLFFQLDQLSASEKSWSSLISKETAVYEGFGNAEHRVAQKEQDKRKRTCIKPRTFVYVPINFFKTMVI